MQFPSKLGRVGLTVFLAAAVAVSARAVEPDKYLPSDSEAVLVINVRQILESPLIKKHALEQIKSQMESNADAKKFFKATGLDPLRDIHEVIVGATLGGGAEPKFLVVVRGKFDVEKIQEAAIAEAKSQGHEMKVVTKGNLKIFEIKQHGNSDKPLYAAFADDKTLIVSQSVEQTETGAKGDGKVTPTLATALSKVGGKESVYGAAVVTDQIKKSMASNPQFRELAPKLEYFTGIFDLTNEFKAKLSVQTSDAKAADKVKIMLGQFVPVIGLMAAGQSENLGPTVTELVKKIEIKKDDNNAVNVSLTVTEQMMKEMEDAAKNGGKTEKDTKQ
jgi:hypothetical protein